LSYDNQEFRRNFRLSRGKFYNSFNIWKF
jgi:hypothetical protein